MLTFQIHEGLVRAAGCTESMHRCSVSAAVRQVCACAQAMAIGASRPGGESAGAMTGSRAVRGEPFAAVSLTT